MLELLMEHRVDSQIQEIYWETALCWTVGAGEELIVRVLDRKAIPGATNGPKHATLLTSGPTY